MQIPALAPYSYNCSFLAAIVHFTVSNKKRPRNHAAA